VCREAAQCPGPDGHAGEALDPDEPVHVRQAPELAIAPIPAWNGGSTRAGRDHLSATGAIGAAFTRCGRPATDAVTRSATADAPLNALLYRTFASVCAHTGQSSCQVYQPIRRQRSPDSP
jgi:hypothetical protein